MLRVRVDLGGQRAKGPKGHQNETREAPKAKEELSKNMKDPLCFTSFSQHGGPKSPPGDEQHTLAGMNKS